jgi:hypothetical protein
MIELYDWQPHLQLTKTGQVFHNIFFESMAIINKVRGKNSKFVEKQKSILFIRLPAREAQNSQQRIRVMSEFTQSTASQDERVMAALAHVSVLMPLMGIIVPIVIWVTQKDKSQYVAFQALQAAGFQISMIAAYFIGMGCYMCSFFSIFLGGSFGSSFGIDPSLNPFSGTGMPFPFLVFGAIILGEFAFIIYGIVGTVMTIQGKPFRYFFIGDRIERFMAQKQDASANQ